MDRGGSCARFQCPFFPFEIASDVAVVKGFDGEPLDVGGAMAQLVGLDQGVQFNEWHTRRFAIPVSRVGST
jgi:hypothetical protein